MALSELHNRLEHLVSYSSQLIFVSGDAIAKQQSLLESFLELQSNNTEVAFFRAPANKSLEEYRRTLCAQLLGQAPSDLQRPINELLASLNQYDGPIIISISQAENLPDRFLQELWGLVLQSRFAKNKQHLNVLLFGQPEWAHKAKNWLPSKNKGKPLLLSNENVPEPSQKETELEALIAQKRKEFDLRLQARAAQQSDSEPNRGWLWLLAVLVFISSFVGLLAWQYAQEIEQIWQQFEQDNQHVQTNKLVDETPEPLAEKTHLPTIEIRPSGSVKAATSFATATSSPTAGLLVTDWQTQLHAMQAPDSPPPSSSPTSVSAIPSDPLASNTAPATMPEQNAMAENAVNDYPVADIVSIEQLPARDSQSEEPQKSALTPQPYDKPQPSAVTQSPFLLDETDILQVPPQSYVIQIAAMSNKQVLDEFLRDHQLHAQVWLYQTMRNSAPWYVVLERQAFPSAQAAQAAISNLSQVKQKGVPFIKRVNLVNQEIQNAL